VLLASTNFLVPNATFVVELVAFLAVLGTLAKWILPHVNRAMEERQGVIERALSDVDAARRRAQEAEQAAEQAIEQARAEARALRDEAAKLGERARQELRRQGEDEYHRLVDRAAADIEVSARRAGEELRSEVAGLVAAAVEKVLGEGISLANQEQLIERAIAELEAEGASVVAQDGGAGHHGGTGAPGRVARCTECGEAGRW